MTLVLHARGALLDCATPLRHRLWLVVVLALGLAACRNRLPTANPAQPQSGTNPQSGATPGAGSGPGSGSGSAAREARGAAAGLPSSFEGLDPARLERAPWKITGSASGTLLARTELRDGGGDVATSLWRMRLRAFKRLGLGAELEVAAVYERRQYDWNGDNDILTETDDPVTVVNGFGVRAHYLQPFHPEWGAFVDVTGRLEAERGAPLSDGASWGAFAGIGKRFPKARAEIAVGAGVIQRPGNQVYYIPVVQGLWMIDENLMLSLFGTALTLRMRASDKWSLASTVAFDSARIRLTDGDPGYSGIFTDSRFTAQLRTTYRPVKNLAFEATLGFDIWRKLYFSTEDGTSLGGFRLRPAPLVGMRIIVDF